MSFERFASFYSIKYMIVNTLCYYCNLSKNKTNHDDPIIPLLRLATPCCYPRL